MVCMDIFENHPEGGPGARAIDLAMYISTLKDLTDTEPCSQDERTQEMVRLIWHHYQWAGESEGGLSVPKRHAPYTDCSLMIDAWWMGDFAFRIANTLYHSLNGNDQKAWGSLVDASFVAGFGAQNYKIDFHIRNEVSGVVKTKNRARAFKVHQKSPKRQTKIEIEKLWNAWQLLNETNQIDGTALYKNKTAFAHDMLDKFPILAGAKKQDPRVIMRWILQWENPEEGL